VAEDLAIEDTMEILAKALDHERISLDVFLKVSPHFVFLLT
jgi:Vps23 core domain